MCEAEVEINIKNCWSCDALALSGYPDPLSPTRVAIVATLTVCVATYFLSIHGTVDRAHLFCEGGDHGGDEPSAHTHMCTTSPFA